MEQAILHTSNLVDLHKVPTVLPRREDVDRLVDDAQNLLRSAGKDISSGISHCIRTPLTTLLGIQEIVKQGMPLSEPQRESFLRIVLFESARLRRFVEMLTWYDEMEKGSFQLHPFTSDVRETVLRAIRGFDPEVLATSVRIVVEPMPVRILLAADHDRLKHVIEQLVLNGLHVSPLGGEVRISVDTDESTFSLRFTNTGPVLSDEQCSLIFKPFKRVPHTHDPGSELGLGLSVVRSIVNAHGGSIACHPVAPTGMTFSVTLPR